MINSPNPPDPPRRGYGPVSPGDAIRTGGDDSMGTAHDPGEKLKAGTRETVEGVRGTAAENLDKLAEGARAAASALHDDDVGHLSEYVSDMAIRMDRLSTSLRTRSGDEILHDVGRMARENPALFVTGSVALGFGLARFARASQAKASPESTLPTTSEDYGRTEGSSTWSPQTGTHDYAATRQPGTSGGTEGGIH